MNKQPIFSGRTKQFLGFWCPETKEFEKPIGREKLITIEWWEKNKEKNKQITLTK